MNGAKRCPPRFSLKEGQCFYDNIADDHNLEDARDSCAANGSKLLELGNYYICEAATLARSTLAETPAPPKTSTPAPPKTSTPAPPKTSTPAPPKTSNGEGTIAWILILTFLIGITVSAALLYLKICLKKDDTLVSNSNNPDNEEPPAIVITEIDQTTESPSQSDTIDEADSVSGHYDVPPVRIESIEPDDTNENSNDNYSYENVGDSQLTDNIYEEIEEHPLPSNDIDEDYDQPTPLRPLGGVPSHYIQNAMGLRRSALRSSTSAFQLPSSQPPLPAFNNKGRFSFNCSRSSNEHNITKSEEASNYIMFFKKFKEKGFSDWLKEGENASKSSSLNSEESDDGYVDIKMKDIKVSVNCHV